MGFEIQGGGNLGLFFVALFFGNMVKNRNKVYLCFANSPLNILASAERREIMKAGRRCVGK